MTKPTYTNTPEGIAVTNSPGRLALYSMICGGVGISMAPYIAAVCLANPSLLPTAMMLTGGVCGGASLYAYMKPSGSLLYLGAPLMGGLISIIGLQLLGLGAYWAAGSTWLLHASHDVSLFVGTGIFTAFMAYDTHVALQLYESGNPDYLQVSVSFFLNFMNLLQRMMELLRMFGGSD